MAVVNVKLVPDKSMLSPGESTVVRIYAQGTAAGLFSLGGYISATGPEDILTSVGPMVFSNPGYTPFGLFIPKAYPGTTNYSKGGFGDLTPSDSGFGTQQTDWGTPDADLGKTDYVEVCHYTVVMDTVPTGPWSVTLHFNAKTVGGYKPLEVDKTGVLGTITDAVIATPEPMTLTLLALGGLFMARRRV
jgi:hypothetical protein